MDTVVYTVEFNDVLSRPGLKFLPERTLTYLPTVRGMKKRDVCKSTLCSPDCLRIICLYDDDDDDDYSFYFGGKKGTIIQRPPAGGGVLSLFAPLGWLFSLLATPRFARSLCIYHADLQQCDSVVWRTYRGCLSGGQMGGRSESQENIREALGPNIPNVTSGALSELSIISGSSRPRYLFDGSL